MPDPISWSFAAPYFAAALVAGYLLGAIPFGLVLTRIAGLGDLRQIGSGNIGATNVLRAGRKDLAAATLALDAAKGTLAVWLGGLYGPDMAVIAGAGAFLGHLFPIWLGFKGGKGVATFFGILLGLAWPIGLGALAAWIATALVFRISSLAGLVAALAAPILAWAWATPQIAEFTLALSALIGLRHAANIRRLLRGIEPRIGAGH